MVPEAVLRAVGEERRSAPEDVWEDELRRLEGIGAALESERAGEAFFAVDGLRGIYGGRLSGVVEAARRAAAMPLRIGVAPTRFAAFAAAGDGEEVVPAGSLARLSRPPPGRRPDPAARPRRARGGGLRRDPADGSASAPWGRSPPWRRPGSPIASARSGCAPCGLARGEEPPLRPRRPHEELAARDRAAGRDRRQPARARPRAARRPLPRRPPAQGAHAARRCASAPCSATAAAGASSRGWAGRPPRRRALRTRAGAAAGGAAGAGQRAAPAGARPRPAGRRPAGALGRRRRSSAAAASARRCARSAPRRAPRRCSGSSRSTPPRASRSGGRS